MTKTAVKELLTVFVLGAACVASAGVERTLSVFGRPLTLTCVDGLPGEFSLALMPSADDAVREVRVVYETPAGRDASPLEFEIRFDLPQLGIRHVWTSGWRVMDLPPDWTGGWTSSVASGQPLYALVDDQSVNKLTLACSEKLEPVTFRAGLNEETCAVRSVWKFNPAVGKPCGRYEVRLRLDRSAVFYGDALKAAADWLAGTPRRLTGDAVPEAAFDPLYSTWYAFHQDVHAEEIEAECAKAAALGMKTVILDDGWQTDDTNRGYAFCGDWQVSTNRFPDMAAHVKKVHALGMRYLMWYAVPFIGEKSRNFGRFRGKYLYEKGGTGAWVLDPRFPEVRSFIAGTYEQAMREWDLDGFKLDFIDAFRVYGRDPALDDLAGRDLLSVDEAVEVLLADITRRLKAIKPDVLIEFRQPYIGPSIRSYGNMFRAGDCPGDLMRNRSSICQLRLTSGGRAVHSDMLEWHPDDTPENAAAVMLSVIFSTVQYSMRLDRLPESHLRMIRHWIAFSEAHREALLKGELRPYHPEEGCPLIVAEGGGERITAVYSAERVVPLAGGNEYVLNGSVASELVVRSDVALRAVIYDTFGTRQAEVTIPLGLSTLAVPPAGYAKVE